MPLEFISGLEREIGITLVTILIIWYFWKQGERMERARLRNHERMLKQDERNAQMLETLFESVLDCFRDSRAKEDEESEVE